MSAHLRPNSGSTMEVINIELYFRYGRIDRLLQAAEQARSRSGDSFALAVKSLQWMLLVLAHLCSELTVDAKRQGQFENLKADPSFVNQRFCKISACGTHSELPSI